MSLRYVIVIFGVLLLTLTFVGAPVHAASGVCDATPASGVAGTAFVFYCSGFSPNAVLNAYVVEPDGRAVSAITVTGFKSNISDEIYGAIKADGKGNAKFVWSSMSGPEYGFSHQIGKWTWVVQELGVGGVANRAESPVWILSKSEAHAGAIIALLGWTTENAYFGPNTRFAWFGASGFNRDEYVNLWVTLPGDCSGRSNVEAANADDPQSIQGIFDGFYGPSSVKANEVGAIYFNLGFDSRACRGWYTVTVRALGSGVSGEYSFYLGGDAVAANAGLFVAPNPVNAWSQNLALYGSGFTAGSQVNCWLTRPDGRVFPLSTVSKVAGDGTFVMAMDPWDQDSYAPFASEEPGMWYATCRSPGDGVAAIAPYWVVANFTP